MDSTMDQYRTAAVTCACFGIRFCRSEELKPGWAKPIKIMSEASPSIEGRRAFLTSSRFVASIEDCNSRSGGYR
jgi:hypothetical protein